MKSKLYTTRERIAMFEDDNARLHYATEDVLYQDGPDEPPQQMTIVTMTHLYDVIEAILNTSKTLLTSGHISTAQEIRHAKALMMNVLTRPHIMTKERTYICVRRRGFNYHVLLYNNGNVLVRYPKRHERKT